MSNTDSELRKQILALDKGTQKGVVTVEVGLNDIVELLAAQKQRREASKMLEHLKALAALAGMYGQYCDGPFGHDFMGAGEDAIEILENYGLAKEDKGVDYEAVTKLEREIDRLSALDGEEA